MTDETKIIEAPSLTVTKAARECSSIEAITHVPLAKLAVDKLGWDAIKDYSWPVHYYEWKARGMKYDDIVMCAYLVGSEGNHVMATAALCACSERFEALLRGMGVAN